MSQFQAEATTVRATTEAQRATISSIAAQLGVNELAPVLLIYHRNAAVGIIMEPLENGVHIEVHPFWMAERCTDPIEVTVVAPAENIG